MAILQLLNINYLNNTYEHTIDFENESVQDKFFSQFVFSNYDLGDDYVYIREHRAVDVNFNKQQLEGVNYLRFKNDSKWWYAFIISKEYIDTQVTRINFEIDVMQTFMFDYSIKESFITREHQDRFQIVKENTMLPLYNLEQEELDAGPNPDVISRKKLYYDEPYEILWCEIITTEPISSAPTFDDVPLPNDSLRLNIDGMQTSYYAYLVPIIQNYNDPILNPSYRNDQFYTYDYQGKKVRLNQFNLRNKGGNRDIDILKSNAILSVRVLDYCPIHYDLDVDTRTIDRPYDIFTFTFLSSYENGIDKTAEAQQNIIPARTVSFKNDNFGGIDLSNIDGYWINFTFYNRRISNIIRGRLQIDKYDKNILDINNNKNIEYEVKLKTYPYEFLNITDNQSDPLLIRNEYITDNNIMFIQNIGINAKNKLYLQNYCNDQGKMYNVTNNKINEIPLVNSAYISYLSSSKASATTGFAVNTATDILGNVVKAGIGIALGNPFAITSALSGVTNVANSVANHMTKIQDLKDTPDSIKQVGNNIEFDLIDGNTQLEIITYRIKDYYRNKIFEYLYHYGYKANVFKVPDLKSRYYFNYISIYDASIDTNIDNEYINEIKRILDKGITFWHYRDESTWKGIEYYDKENVEMSIYNIQGD